MNEFKKCFKMKSFCLFSQIFSAVEMEIFHIILEIENLKMSAREIASELQ